MSFQGKISYYHPLSQQLKGSDTSTAESGSEAEDIASPKANRNYSHFRLTPVREEVCLKSCSLKKGDIFFFLVSLVWE